MNHIYTLFLFITYFGYAQLAPPTNLQAYYSGVDFTKTGTNLFDDLAVITASKHTNFLTYTPGIWEASRITDEDPFNSNNVLLIYGYSDLDRNYVTDRSRSKTLNGGTAGSQWNREHTFPNSLGNPSLETGGDDAPPYADAHNLRPSDVTMNSNRGNLKFAAGSGTAQNVSGNWYPGDEWKGDVARIAMYMYLRYGNQCKPSFVSVGTTNAIDPDMINLLLIWNAEDPVSAIENQRNAYHGDANNTFAQGNRNPFIDNPYLATIIWGGANAENKWGSSAPADTEAPTMPTNLTASNETINTVDLNWTASTDNVGVLNYNIFINNAFYVSTNSSATTVTVSGLNPNTAYTFAVLATDLALNTSALSNTANATTLASNTGGGNSCASETFENIGAGSNSYSTRSWVGDNGGTWAATSARTDQTLGSNKTITIAVRGANAGSISSPSVSGGIGSLTATTLRNFSGGTGNLDVFVNDIKVGVLPYSDAVQTTTISNINVEGAIKVGIFAPLPTTGVDGDRVAVDNLSWTCYPTLSSDTLEIDVFKLYPNPIVGNTLHIKTTKNADYIIYDMLGKIMRIGTVSPSKQTIDVTHLTKGMYLIQLTTGNQNTIKKIIKH